MEIPIGKEALYPECPHCGNQMAPVYFTEEETKIKNGVLYKTGRKRRAVSHIECPICFKKECVDDTFDGPWT